MAAGGNDGTDDLELRPLRRADFPLLTGWLAQPHVAQWWGAPITVEGLESEFGPCIDGTDPTFVFVVEERGAPVGLAQCYRLTDNLEYAQAVEVQNGAGIDLLIGHADRCGQGLGPRMIRVVLAEVWDRYPEVDCAMAGPSVENTRSHRAFEKAGFRPARQVSVPGEPEDELIFVCPRPTAG
jgi:aminoglycoside 6'-N-acetyltransferase